ncbi:DedA family inner membrane protein YqjA [Klebsiella pneumoniae]|nr:DedA family inner membrane protein YqjA [Klebsiella pneumoniae]
MELFTQLLNALWAQDYETLANPSMIGMLYFVLFMILFLENGLLPAAFLPGDSLLVLVGVLIAKGAMGFPETLLLLTAAASLGCWLSYIQGRWLGNTRIVQNWLSHLPSHYHQRAHHLFHKHGLSALLIGRFIAFVRTLLPTIAGLSGLNNARFQFFNWMSGLLWVLILTSLGYLLGKTARWWYCGRKNTEAGANDGHETPFPAPVQLAAGWFSSARRPVLALAGGAAAGGHAGDTPGWPGYRNAGRFLRLASSRCQRHPL